MQKTTIELLEIMLVGITCRTNNKQLFESDPQTNKIAATVQKYFHEGFSSKILNRKNLGTTYCAYTEYESDLNGDFTYLIGEQVTSLEAVPEGFTAITVPAQKYAKFTNEPGPMPDVCIDMWKTIWSTEPKDLGGYRNYKTDFELYDERSSDHDNVVLDIYIGIK